MGIPWDSETFQTVSAGFRVFQEHSRVLEASHGFSRGSRVFEGHSRSFRDVLGCSSGFQEVSGGDIPWTFQGVDFRDFQGVSGIFQCVSGFMRFQRRYRGFQSASEVFQGFSWGFKGVPDNIPLISPGTLKCLKTSANP